MYIDAIFKDLGIILILATFFGFAARAFKQPLIPAYVLTGLILGPVLHVVKDQSILSTLSEMGIAFLLFIVGMEIDLKKLRNVGLVTGLGGVAKCLLLFSSGFVLLLLFGFRTLDAVYIGLVLAFSSTMVVIKILSDKRELDTLHGRLIIGYLLVQDLLAIIALSLLGSLGSFTPNVLFLLMGKGLLLFVLAFLANRWIFPPLFRFAARSIELLFTTAVSTCFLFALLAASLGFSVSIGAFVAGLVLANLPYSYEIIGKVRSIRDFFSIIFFVTLGMSIQGIALLHLPLITALLLLIWLGKPLVIFFMTAFFGYTRKPSFLTALSLSQTSEFALIIATQGLIAGHIGQELFSIIAVITVLSMGTTSYVMKYQYSLYERMKGFLKRFDGFANGEGNGNGVETQRKRPQLDVLLVGYDRIGYSILKKLHLLRKRILVVDYNPEIIQRLRKQGISCIYGDISDADILEHINFRKLSLVISTSPSRPDNELLIKRVKSRNPSIQVFVTAYRAEDALALYDVDADYVIVPHFLGGDHVSLLIEQFSNNLGQLLKHRVLHIKELEHRHRSGHDAPSS